MPSREDNGLSAIIVRHHAIPAPITMKIALLCEPLPHRGSASKLFSHQAPCHTGTDNDENRSSLRAAASLRLCVKAIFRTVTVRCLLSKYGSAGGSPDIVRHLHLTEYRNCSELQSKTLSNRLDAWRPS